MLSRIILQLSIIVVVVSSGCVEIGNKGNFFFVVLKMFDHFEKSCKKNNGDKKKKCLKNK